MMTKKKPANDRLPPTLCWRCKNAVPKRRRDEYVRGCEWSISHEPVEGWEAIPTMLKNAHVRANANSFVVIRCPKFERG